MDYVDFIEEMRVFDADTSAVPQLGIFWFDEDSESLFEVHTKAFDPDRVVNGLLLYTKTHEFWWEKARSASCNRSSSLYSKCFNEVPRGRVTFADGRFIVNVGSWYESYVDILRALVVEEFAIPTDFEFVVDESLELGHGFDGKS